jgi:hypothetical protein
MNMAADHTVKAPSSSFGGHRVFEVADETDSVLDLVLEVLRQRPIRQTKFMAYVIKPVV